VFWLHVLLLLCASASYEALAVVRARVCLCARALTCVCVSGFVSVQVCERGVRVFLGVRECVMCSCQCM
jgi:hypothetical protein